MKCDECNVEILGKYWEGDFGTILCVECGDEILIFSETLDAYSHEEIDECFVKDRIADIEFFKEAEKR